jgi:hypothetical protein
VLSRQCKDLHQKGALNVRALVHCGSVVSPAVVSFVECCPMGLVWLPKGDQARP